jgi:hypothetical protein
LHIELLDSLNSMLTFHSIYKIIAHIERRGETRMLKTKLFWRENIATPSWKKLKGGKIPQSRKVEHQWGPVQMSLHLREFTEFYVDGEIYGNCKGFLLTTNILSIIFSHIKVPTLFGFQRNSTKSEIVHWRNSNIKLLFREVEISC